MESIDPVAQPEPTLDASPSCAPIALFVYNRPEHTRRALESLAANPLAAQSTLYIFSDGPRTPEDRGKVEQVRKIISEKAWCGAVYRRASPYNQGLARSVMAGVTEVVNRHGTVIVLEDDLQLSTQFLSYMNEALRRYRDDSKVMQISGYMFPVEMPQAMASCFVPLITSWGWATWARAWKHFDPDMHGWEELENNHVLRRRFDVEDTYPYLQMLKRQTAGKIDSWAIRWYYSVFRAGGLTLCPARSLVQNIGCDGTGVHCGTTKLFDVNLSHETIDHFPDSVQVTDAAYQAIQGFYAHQYRRPCAVKPLAASKPPRPLIRRAGSRLKRYCKIPVELLRRGRRWVARRLHPPLQAQIHCPLEFHGSAYGGRCLCPEGLSAGSIVYSLGVGEDITFDLSLIRQFGASVFAFDPTPRALAWLQRQQLPPEFHFMPYGIAGFDGSARFYPPQDPAHVSHTIVPRENTSTQAISVPMRRLKTVMDLYGHASIDVLKLDIEGAEYEVVEDLMATKLAPRQLLVEVHYGANFGDLTIGHVQRMVKQLNQYGYRIANIGEAGKEFCFVRGMN